MQTRGTACERLNIRDQIESFEVMRGDECSGDGKNRRLEAPACTIESPAT